MRLLKLFRHLNIISQAKLKRYLYKRTTVQTSLKSMSKLQVTISHRPTFRFQLTMEPPSKSHENCAYVYSVDI